MTKFSTAALLLALASASTSFAATAAETGRCAFLAHAPDQHVVVKGDTLWDISGKFLRHPWCWPDVWGMNREQIRDPHWIYPGQIVYLDREAGRLRLGKRVGAPAGTTRMVPQIRTEALGAEAIPSIPAGAIQAFLSQAIIIEEGELQGTPRIMAAREGRVILGKGDTAYVRGDLSGGTSFQVFRPGVPLKDPVTKEVIGYESAYLGSASLQREARAADEAHVFKIVSSKEEIGIGDRLLAVPPAPMLNFAPHRPDQTVDARIVSIYGGVNHAGQNQIVAINRGKRHGVDIGAVLDLSRAGVVVADKTDNKNPVRLPDHEYGSLFVFRAFNNMSYGLVMQVTDTVKIGDLARSPQ